MQLIIGDRAVVNAATCQAIIEAQKSASNVATRNKRETQEQPKSKSKPPTLFNDRACKRGKKLFSKQDELAAKEIFAMRSGVGQANPATKMQIRIKGEELRNCLNQLNNSLHS